MPFEWDEQKAEANLAKHGVSFEEAKTVFEDMFNIEFFDPDHSIEEERFLIVGESRSKRLLIVSYTDRQGRIRIISARPVTGKERRDYENGRFE
jgi:uncharacterized DUF497 family protein